MGASGGRRVVNPVGLSIAVHGLSTRWRVSAMSTAGSPKKTVLTLVVPRFMRSCMPHTHRADARYQVEVSWGDLVAVAGRGCWSRRKTASVRRRKSLARAEAKEVAC